MKFLLVEDHALFRQGMLLLVQDRFPGNHEFLESESCEAGFSLAAAHGDIDVILLDLALPGTNGLEGIVRFQQLCVNARIVLLSANDNSNFIVEGMRRGARGFIPKSASPEVVIAALQIVLGGGTYVPAAGVAREPKPGDDARPLTERQREVLQLLLHGKSNKEIADALGMRVNTVRVHVTAILKSLGVSNRSEAARTAFRVGLNENDS
jgi:two-component system nitrate/nitrite response regulator NarL